MSELLSQEEINALLADGDHEDNEKAEKIEAPGSVAKKREAAPYDFRRPCRISPMQRASLSRVHGRFAGQASRYLGGYLRKNMCWSVASIEQLSSQESYLAIMNPAYTAAFAIEPAGGCAAIYISAPIAFAMIDRTVGGRAYPVLQRGEFTDIEEAILENIAEALLKSLSAAWACSGSFQLRSLWAEDYPPDDTPSSQEDMVLMVALQAKMDKCSGIVTVIYPYSSIAEMLCMQESCRYKRNKKDKHDKNKIEQNLDLCRLRISAEIGCVKITVQDLIRLEPGEILKAKSRQSGDIIVSVSGMPKFLGKSETYKRHRSVRITSRIHERRNM